MTILRHVAFFWISIFIINDDAEIVVNYHVMEDRIMRKLVFLIAAIILGFVIAETWADDYYPEVDQTPAQSYVTASAEDTSVVYLPNEEDRSTWK